MDSEIFSFLDGIESELDRRIQTLSTLNDSYTSLLNLLRRRQEQERQTATQAELLIRNEIQSLTMEEVSSSTSSPLNGEDEYLEAILRKAKLAKGIKPDERKAVQDDQGGRRTRQRAKSESKGKLAEKLDEPKKDDILSEHIRSTLALAADQKRVNVLRLLIPSGERLRIETAFLSGTDPSLPFNPLFAAMLSTLRNHTVLKSQQSTFEATTIPSESLALLLRRYSGDDIHRAVKAHLDSTASLSADQIMEVMTQWFMLNYCFYLFSCNLRPSTYDASQTTYSKKLHTTFSISEDLLFSDPFITSAFENMQYAHILEFRRLFELVELQKVVDKITAVCDHSDDSKSPRKGAWKKYKLLHLLLHSKEKL